MIYVIKFLNFDLNIEPLYAFSRIRKTAHLDILTLPLQHIVIGNLKLHELVR